MGAAERYEYTVIGDPVNEASRLSDLAKVRAGSVVVNAGLLDVADAEERRHWSEGDAVTVRGRLTPTRIATLGMVPDDGGLVAG